jgi:hypothetical protein
MTSLAGVRNRILLFVAMFSIGPLVTMRIVAGSGARGALAASVVRAAPSVSLKIIGIALLASIAVAVVLAVASMWAWPRSAACPWIRVARIAALLWVLAFVLYPGMMSVVPGLRAWPWPVGVGVAVAGTLALFAVPAARPATREYVALGVMACIFFWSPAPPNVDIKAIAGRDLNERDVVLVGFDSISQQDSAAVLAHVSPTRGRKTVFTNAWTPVSTTSTAWRTIFSGRYPVAEGLLPGSKWPLDYESWLPRELASRGYTTVMMQDEPATNVYGAEEWVSISGEQGWQSLMKDYVWRAVFPVSVVGAHWWVAALGGPANSVTRYAYRPEWFRHDVLKELAKTAQRGPVLFATHTCYVHAPIHLALGEVLRLKQWWKRSPRALEGAGNPFTDSGTAGGTDVLEERIASTRSEIGVWLAEMDRAGILGRAMVVLLSDHGPRGGWLPQERTEHIQMAVFAPGPWSDTEVRVPVSLIDLAPTIRAHLGLPTLPGPGVVLPAVDVTPLPRRLLGRVNAVTLDSAGVRLETVDAKTVTQTLSFEADGSFAYAPELSKRVAANTRRYGPADGDLIQFVDHGG